MQDMSHGLIIVHYFLFMFLSYFSVLFVVAAAAVATAAC
jgi:hypothetical protein